MEKLDWFVPDRRSTSKEAWLGTHLNLWETLGKPRSLPIPYFEDDAEVAALRLSRCVTTQQYDEWYEALDRWLVPRGGRVLLSSFTAEEYEDAGGRPGPWTAMASWAVHQHPQCIPASLRSRLVGFFPTVAVRPQDFFPFGR